MTEDSKGDRFAAAMKMGDATHRGILAARGGKLEVSRPGDGTTGNVFLTAYGDAGNVIMSYCLEPWQARQLITALKLAAQGRNLWEQWDWRDEEGRRATSGDESPPQEEAPESRGESAPTA